MSKTAATGTIHLRGIGRRPAVEAQLLRVGDTLMWNEGETTEVLAIVEASPKFVRITEKSSRTGTTHDRRLMKTRLVARVAESPQQPQPAAVGNEAEAVPASVAALGRQFPAGSTAVYVPEEGEALRDVVIVKSAPDANGTVEAISARHGLSPIRVALDKLQPMPELSPVPEGKPSGWFGIFDREGKQITQVQATGYEDARKEAEKDPKARAASRTAGGLVYRRLYTSEVTAPQPAAITAAPADRAVTVHTEFVGRSIPTRLRAAGAPGGTAMGSTGLLVWRLPGGEELTPGEAAKRFLDA